MWDFLLRKAASCGIFLHIELNIVKIEFTGNSIFISCYIVYKRCYFAEIFKNMYNQAILAPSSFIVDSTRKSLQKLKKKKKVGGATFDHASRTNQLMKFSFFQHVTKLLFSHVHQLEISFPIPFSLYSFGLLGRHDSKILFRFVQFSSLFFRLMSC